MGFPPSAAAVATVRILAPLSWTLQPCLSVALYLHSGAFISELKRLNREDDFPIIRVNFCFQKFYPYAGAGWQEERQDDVSSSPFGPLSSWRFDLP